MAFTYFFRDKSTLDAIAEHVVPRIRSRRYINIWDAGCAMGPEPYSLAIILRENMGDFIFRNVKIYATDVDHGDEFGKIIREGVYPNEQIKRIPAHIREKYFSPNGNPDQFILSQEIRNRVEFEKHDLLTLKPLNKDFCLILCKNVLLHFKEQKRVEVIRMFHGVLGQGGFLVMEQTQNLPRELSSLFEPFVSNTQLYRKIGDKQK